MADWKKLIERVDQFSAELVQLEAANSEDLSRLFKVLSALRSEPEVKEVPALAKVIVSAATAVSSLKASAPGKAVELLAALSGSLKASFECLDRGEEPVRHIKMFEDKMKEILSTIKAAKPERPAVSAGSPEHVNSIKEEADKGVGALVANPPLNEDLLSKKKEAPAPFVPQVPVLDLSGGPGLMMDFTNESFDHLTNSEKSVLILETSPKDSEAINNIFRAFHTIKGAAGFLELKDIRVYAHEAETMLDMVRKGTLKFEGRIVEMTLASIDVMRKLMTLLQEQIVNNGQLHSPYPNIGPDIMALKEITAPKEPADEKARPVPSVAAVPPKEGVPVSPVEKPQPVGEILVKQGAVTEEELQNALKIQKETVPDMKVGEILVATSAASAKQVQSALDMQKLAVPVETSIKIQVEKLDMLIDLVGELVISETQVVQSPGLSGVEDQGFHRDLSELDRITRRLQKLVMTMRLVPVGPVFQKMVRLVRDVSKKLGKEVTITLAGEETEIDKNMVELVADPIMHMVRNSLDHGIEPKDERLAKGKPAAGKLELSAFHKGGYVVIEIKDDGGGLRKDKILKKALERGIINENESLSENRIFNLIFEPGFSTADKITDISGRGVGMDVVKKNIDRLRGKIDISSEEGKGSVFSISLPITLAIIEGILVRTGGERYILPINSVIEFLQPKESLRHIVQGKNEMYRVGDEVYALIHLDRVLNVSGGCPDFERQTICVVDSDYGRACIIVDELLGQKQVVIKSLGERFKAIEGVSGAAILGDGRVGLILDVSSLVQDSIHHGD